MLTLHLYFCWTLAVVGATFGRRLLLHMLPNHSRDRSENLHAALLKLIEANFISRSVVGQTERFSFVHTSVQEVNDKNAVRYCVYSLTCCHVLTGVVLRQGSHFRSHSPASGCPTILTALTLLSFLFLVPESYAKPLACIREQSLPTPEERVPCGKMGGIPYRRTRHRGTYLLSRSVGICMHTHIEDVRWCTKRPLTGLFFV